MSTDLQSEIAGQSGSETLSRQGASEELWCLKNYNEKVLSVEPFLFLQKDNIKYTQYMCCLFIFGNSNN